MKTSPPVATAVLISSGTIAENATEYNAAAAFRINSALIVHQSFVLGARWSTTTRARTQSPSTIPCLQDPATTTRPTRLATPRRTAASTTMTQQPPQQHSNILNASRTTTATKAAMTENTTNLQSPTHISQTWQLQQQVLSSRLPLWQVRPEWYQWSAKQPRTIRSPSKVHISSSSSNIIR